MSNGEKDGAQFESVLRRAMVAQPGAATRDCPDAGIFAAYYDRALSAGERERLDAHFADCARCQAQLAAIARADDGAAVRATPIFGWLRGWRIAIPALAAAAVLLVVVQSMRTPGIVSQGVQLAANEDLERRAAPLEPEAPAASAPAAPAAAPALPAAPSLASDEIAVNQPMSATSHGLVGANRLAEEKGALSREALGGAAPAPQLMAKQAVNEREMDALKSKAVPPQEPAGGASSSVLAQTRAATKRAEAFTRPPPFAAIQPPDRSKSWIIGQHGLVLLRDSNSRIHIVGTGVTADLLAGASSSATVCWIVGRGGTIVRTIDGENWSAVVSPVKDDLTAVSATSANDAVITTADGKSFATTDGGASWHQK
ncbi:MAG TPA: zf-HC2 domain-containing protein [Candidatus Binataceae bacterium]|nr:zf-HC2 domain-containing protein [Candidatus Binataceae bacterium]